MEWLLKAERRLAVVLALVLMAGVRCPASRPSSRVAGLGLGHLGYGVVDGRHSASGGGRRPAHGYGRLLARAEHVRQFTRMSELFAAGERELERLTCRRPCKRSATALIRDLGIEALDENSDWLILHRERPLEVPPG